MRGAYVLFVCIMIYGVIMTIGIVLLSSFYSTYAALKSDVTRYYTLYNVAKLEQDENGMSEAFAKLKSCFDSYQNVCAKRDGLIALTSPTRVSYPNLFLKIDRDTEEMEAIFTVCRLKA